LGRASGLNRDDLDRVDFRVTDLVDEIDDESSSTNGDGSIQHQGSIGASSLREDVHILKSRDALELDAEDPPARAFYGRVALGKMEADAV
jgi:hypothetical protein